jgi:malonyl-CoA decarboxylase
MVIQQRVFGELAERWRRLGRSSPPRNPGLSSQALCDRLLSAESGSVKVRCAGELLDRFAAGPDAARVDFLNLLAGHYNADVARLQEAIAAYQAKPDAQSMARLHALSEPKRQQILRHLNQAPGGTAKLLQMRCEARRLSKEIPEYQALDADFAHLFASWFNGGFLILKRLDWSASGAVLTKLMDYEAVHEIESWQALRARLEPADRRCYAFFHPKMEDEPLIFVEVALTEAIPVTIEAILRYDRPVITPERATTAVFYSISNCQDGLRGIPFGGPLIKQVVDLLRSEMPDLRTTVTLSPMPGFARWLERAAHEDPWDRVLVDRLAQPGWHESDAAEAIRPALLKAAARYLLTASGRDADPVARFHLGNGARVEQLDWLGDVSAKGLRQSYGMMVNYLYDPNRIEENYRNYADSGRIEASHAVRRLLKDDRATWRAARAELAGMKERE